MVQDNKKPLLVELEEKVLKFWNERNIFEKIMARTKRVKPFIFYEGPPTANGLPHIGHAETRAFKDIILRYKTMRGFWVMRKAGWDTHGLPVEIEVEKKLGLRSKADIEKFGIAKFNQACRESVWKYKEEWENFSKRIGFWIDFKDPYITYDNTYIESLWWIIQQFWKKGYLYEDYKVVPWCPRCGTPLASHELALEGGYEQVTEDSIYVKFKIRDSRPTSPGRSPGGRARFKIRNSYFLAWTTTPWTLPGNAALAVGEDIRYAVVQVGSESFIVAKALVQKIFGQVAKIKKEMKGKELVGLHYEPLFDGLDKTMPEGIENAFQVLPADFASEEEGTGIVHTAVMYGEDDFSLGKKFNLPRYHTVDLQGRFTKDVPEFEGMFVKDADPEIIRNLEKRGLILKVERITHDYPFCWRCKTPVLYYAREAWWVKRKTLRKEFIEANQKINWIPSHLREGRFGEWLREIKDWAFSRERFWGTPLPVWKCTHCRHVEVVGSLEEIKKLSVPLKNRYFILRHGEAETNAFGLASSWSEHTKFHLTEKGRSQIKRLIPKLEKAKFNLIFSSDLTRTKETTEIITKALGIKVEFKKELREFNMGDFSEKPIEEHERYFKDRDRFTAPFPGGESWNDLRSRMVNFIQQLEEEYVGKNILLISHGDPLWMLEASWQGLPEKEILDYPYIKPGELRELPRFQLPLNEKGILDVHRPYIDEVKLRCPKCKQGMQKVKEVVDVWFDSGGMPFAQFHYPFSFAQNKPSSRGHSTELSRGLQVEGKLKIQNKIFKKLPYPADFITEAVDQTRGWFNSLLNVSVLLGEGASYKNVISFGHVLDKNGKKMSKHLGNVVEPNEMMHSYGADALRWYFFTVNQPEEPKRFSEEDLAGIVRGFLMILWNIFQFLQLYGPKEKVNDGMESKTGVKAQVSVLDEWIFSKLYSLVKEVTDCLDGYNVVDPARAIQKFVIEDLSQWWLRRSRKRFQQPESEKALKEATEVLVKVLEAVVRIISPFTPFMAESLWLKFKPWLNQPEESVHMALWPDAKKFRHNSDIEKYMVWAREVVSKALAMRQSAQIKVRQPLGLLRIKGQKKKEVAPFLDIIKDEINVKNIEVDPRFKEGLFLDTTITPALREEGMVRELIRLFQEMRREAGMKPRDTAGALIQGTIITYLRPEHLEEMKRAARLKFIDFHGEGTFIVERELDLEGEKVKIGLKRLQDKK